MAGDKKLTGAMGAMLAQSEQFRDRQAPKADISGLNLSALEIPAAETDSPAPKKEESRAAKNKAAEKSTATGSSGKKRPATTYDKSTQKPDDKFLVRLIPAEKIKPWKYANRPESEFGNWDEFVKSIAEGIEVPIIVRPDTSQPGSFEVIAGRRRWKACLELGIKVPANVRTLTDAEAARVQQLENDKRDGLSAWADAMFWSKLLNDGVYKSQSALAVALERDRRVISEHLAYTKLPGGLIEAIGPMSGVGLKMVKLLSRLCSDNEQNIPKLVEIADKIRDGKISVSKVTEHCRTGTTNSKTNTVKVNGQECFTVRNDSNGTPTISLRKDLLEHVSVDDCLKVLLELAEAKVK